MAPKQEIHSMKLENINISDHEVLITPDSLKSETPVSTAITAQINESRKIVRNIISKTDKRLLVVVGPCSIHDTDAAIDYAQRLKNLSLSLNEKLYIVMRSYFEKPRSTVGWKGLINDPYLDDSFKISEGLKIARKLLLDISEIGLPLATEALDPITPQYLQDLISWSAIGARTTESQTHREMASGLSCAIGFKNGTDGSLEVAINAMQSAVAPHRFLGINPSGQVSIIHTRGNPDVHVVLRGGADGPNYQKEAVLESEQQLQKKGLNPSIMIDCSHANSNKDHKNQSKVLDNVGEQIREGNESITGVMIESNIGPGNQSISDKLEYGVSITDACVDWDETEQMLTNLAEKLP